MPGNIRRAISCAALALATGVAVLVWWPRLKGLWQVPGPVPELSLAQPNYSQIAEGLFMGGSVEAPPPGTRAVLNLCEIDDPYRCEFPLRSKIPDAAPAPTLAWLRQQVEFVDAQRRAGRPVFIHCAAGISRAGMVTTAYFMFKNNWSRDQALAFVRSKRPQVNPNPAFMELLLEWQRELGALELVKTLDTLDQQGRPNGGKARVPWNMSTPGAEEIPVMPREVK